MTVALPRFSANSPSMPPAFHVMIKPSGAVCNLACRYCFYRSKEGLYPGGGFRLSNGLLENYIRQHIEAHRAPEVTFTWQGGEPTLMGLDFFRKAVKFQQKYQKPGTRILNAFQTNGTLLTAEWCKFFHENGFLVGISLDGPRALHDAWRVGKRGAPTFDRVMAGLAVLRDHKVDFNVLACVHAANAAHGLEIYRFLRDEAEAAFIQFIPIVERDEKDGSATRWSITGRQYGEFLISVFDEWVRKDVGRVFVQIFDVALGVWFGQPSTLCVFSQTCGNGVILEHNGDLFSCDHFVDAQHKLGNIHRTHLAELIASPRQRKFGQDKRDTLPPACLACPVRFVWNGGCPKDRFNSAAGEPPLNVLCQGYRAFFTHIAPAMKIMADLLRQHRPPSEIMAMEGRFEEKSRQAVAAGSAGT